MEQTNEQEKVQPEVAANADHTTQVARLERPAKERLIVQDSTEDGIMMDTARFEQAQRVSQTLGMSAFLPAHLRSKTGNVNETIANCFRVVNQAIRWGMDPFNVADETYAVGGKLGYQGKLVAAIVNTRANLAGRLVATYSGEGDGRTVKVVGRFNNETEPREIELSVAQAKTENKMWKSDPDQKLYYSAVVKWARRHCPEVVLGVHTDDDVEKMAQGAVEPYAAPPTGTTSLMLPAPRIILLKAEIAAGKRTIGDVLGMYPTLDEAQVNDLRSAVKPEPAKAEHE